MQQRNRLFAFAIAATLAAGSAIAADNSVYLSMRNKIGLLAWCQGKGHIGAGEAAAAAAKVKKAVDYIGGDAKNGKEAGDAAETAGKAGQYGSMKTPVEKFATMMDSTPLAQCKEWAQ